MVYLLNVLFTFYSLNCGVLGEYIPQSVSVVLTFFHHFYLDPSDNFCLLFHFSYTYTYTPTPHSLKDRGSEVRVKPSSEVTLVSQTLHKRCEPIVSLVTDRRCLPISTVTLLSDCEYSNNLDSYILVKGTTPTPFL